MAGGISWDESDENRDAVAVGKTFNACGRNCSKSEESKTWTTHFLDLFRGGVLA